MMYVTSGSCVRDRTVITKLILGIPGQSQKATQVGWSKTLILHIPGRSQKATQVGRSKSFTLHIPGRSTRILHMLGNVPSALQVDTAVSPVVAPNPT